MDQLSGYEKLSGLIIIFEDTKVKSHVGIKIYGLVGLTTNGTAVVLVNVARRSNRRGTCPVRPGKLSRCEKGMARVFAVRVQSLLSFGCDRGTSFISG
jgi:hypothetical protein